MTEERPDLSGLAPEVLAYIEALEARLDALESDDARAHNERLEPSEPPTTQNVITISRRGVAKRTPRHFYTRQRRGGMGVFDLDCDDNDAPAFLLTADVSAGMVIVTDRARAFRLPVTDLREGDVRADGHALGPQLGLQEGEQIALAFPDSGDTYLNIVTVRGQVRRFNAHYFGTSLRAGTILFDVREIGAPAASCWSSGGGDLFIATQQGKGIRFSERQVPVRGCLGLRVDPGDTVVGVAGTAEEDGVFLLTDDGKGTIRLMAGFSANKSPGSGGKVAIKSDAVVGIAPVRMADLARTDLFAISRLSKIIRFQAEEVPPKEGVVQGVNCMNLRADTCTALAAALVPPPPA
ncbi:MAG: DNA gyrase C-terminal beta-propeller domain-containing protein [Caldilineaceae bacterium]